MRLEPLYRVRFGYPEGWSIELEGGWEQHLYLAEGRCEGGISGRFRGANFPRRRTAEGPFCPDFRAVIETDDGATVMVESQGSATSGGEVALVHGRRRARVGADRRVT